MWKNLKVNNEKKTQPLQSQAGNVASSLRLPSKTVEGKRSASGEQYAIMVSCRCNYTGDWLPLVILCYLNALSIQLFLIFLFACRVKIVFQTTNKLATTYLKGSHDICCI